MVLPFDIVMAFNSGDTFQLYVGAVWAAPPVPNLVGIGSELTVEVF
jgi:hypothetical protein